MRNNFYFLFYFFDNPIIRWLRVAVFLVIGILVYLNIQNSDFVIRLLPVYFLLILQEFFIHFKLENTNPQKNIKDGISHPIEIVDYKTRSKLERQNIIEKVIEKLLSESEVKYFNRLLRFSYKKTNTVISEEQLLRKSLELVNSVKGKYIHGIDLYVSYLMLIDESQKILLENDVTKEDLITVLSWVRKQYFLDVRKPHGFYFTGSGVFDFFVYGWSAVLSHYAYNFTKEVLSKANPLPIGRSREYDLLVTALSKNSSSNAILIGNAGVGKSALVSELVLDSNNGNLPKTLSNKLVFKLYPERILAGINNEGDLEERIVNLFSELIHAGNIIVYIPNIENIFGGGGLNVDFSGVLVDYLRSSKIKIIGSTTREAYKKYIFEKAELKTLFDSIEVEEPDSETVHFMLLEKAKELESINGIKISYPALKESAALSVSYINDGTGLPGSAVKLLEDTIAYCMTHGMKSLDKKNIRDFVEEKTEIVLSAPSEEESQELLNIESEMHKRVIAQNEAVKAVSDAMRRVRSGMKDESKPIASFLFLGPTGVGKTETAKALANSFFGQDSKMIRLDMSEYQGEGAIERFLGSSGNQDTLADKIVSNPYCEILLDEFEKANPKILDLFLQILDEGRLTDNLNRTVSFNNSIIIATSNAGSEYVRETYKNGVSQNVKERLVEKLLSEGAFKPELLNRFDDVIVFQPLSQADVSKVAKIFLDEVILRASDKQIEIVYDDSVCDYIAKNAYSVEFGARNIKRFIEQSVENQLSKLILSHDLTAGEKATITIENDSLVIKS